MERVIKRWQLTTAPVVTGIAAFAVIAVSLGWRLSSLTQANAANFEQSNIIFASHGWETIWQFPFNAPYFALVRTTDYFTHSLFYHRLIGAVTGLVICGLFYYIAHKWVGYKLAALGTVLFGTSSYFLHTTRIVDPVSFEMLVSLGLLALFCATHKQCSAKGLWTWAVALPIMLYIPGAIWLVILAVFLVRQQVKEAFQQLDHTKRIVLATVSLVILIPLLRFLVASTIQERGVSELVTWIGFNLRHSLGAFSDYAHTFLSVPVHLFWHGDGVTNPAWGVGNLPVLDIPIAVLVLLGLYVQLTRRRDQRWRFTLLLVGVSWLVIGLGFMNRTLIVPILYLLATVGMAYLLSEWYKVFPYNPIARPFGLALLVIIVAISCTYNLRSYFVAWPHNINTLQTFNCPPAPPRPYTCSQANL